MRIAVFGVGGVGGVFGAALAAAGHEVVFIARGDHLAAMQSQGLRVVGRREIHIDPVIATDDPNEVGPVDFVLLTVKRWSIAEVVAMMPPLLCDATAVVTLQNGVDAAEEAATIIDAQNVMPGVAEISAAIEAPGRILIKSDYARMCFGEIEGRASDRGKALEAAGSAAGLDAEFTTDIKREQWKKFMFLAPVSGMTSVARSTFGAVRTDPDTRALVEDGIREVIAVAKAQGVTVEPDAFERTIALVDRSPPEARASMAIDLARGNRLELPWLSGAVARLGRELGVPTPVNSFINAALKLHQDGMPAADN